MRQYNAIYNSIISEPIHIIFSAGYNIYFNQLQINKHISITNHDYYYSLHQ